MSVREEAPSTSEHPTGMETVGAPVQQVVTVHLQNIPLLKGVDKATLERLVPVFQFRTVARGGFVLHKGGSGEHLLFLLTGRLQAVDVSEEGREIGLSIIVPGDYFGDLAIIDGLPRSASVVACEASLVAFLPRVQALDLIYNNPLVAERVLKRMASKIRDASNYRAILGIPNAFQRVFALLNQIAKIAPGGLVIIEKMPTQQEIAIMVNTSRETVSRAIHALIQKGVVEKDMRRLIVRHPDALREAVNAEQGQASENP
jgi:CRP/FNR family cyclic AMP-dependent transcriptional regulator